MTNARRILTGSEIARLHKAKCDAGPELYEALAEMVEVNHTFPSGLQKRHAAFVKAKAALAKADAPDTSVSGLSHTGGDRG